MENFYELFNLPNFSSVLDVKCQYQKFAKEFHPDKLTASQSGLTEEECTQMFVKINEAWKILKKSNTKAQYDVKLRQFEQEKNFTVNDTVSINDFVTSECDDEVFECGDQFFIYPCRCGGQYQFYKSDFEFHQESVLISCSNCSLCIKVMLKQ